MTKSGFGSLLSVSQITPGQSQEHVLKIGRTVQIMQFGPLFEVVQQGIDVVGITKYGFTGTFAALA